MDLWPDLAEWLGPTPNQGPAMVEQRGVVVHIAAGYYLGTIAWQKNPDASVSSTFVVAGPRDAPYGIADGKIAQLVPTDVAAWTQRAGNGHWCSIEFSGFVGDSLSAAQIESGAQLLARGHREYGWKLQIASNPDGLGLGHHSMGSNEGPCTWPGANWGHCACPGVKIIAQKPIIVARAREIANGGSDMSDVVYEIASADSDWSGKFFLSNRVERRGPIRTRGGVFNAATAGTTRFVLTDAMRTTTAPDGTVSVQPWESFLTDVAGPPAPIGGDGTAHDHDFSVPVTVTVSGSGSGTASGTTGPAQPVG